MQNVQMRLSGNKLTIEVDLAVVGCQSRTGKTRVVASTRGNQPVEFGDSKVFVGLNVFKKDD